jgi:Trypsin-like peptidase domain
MPTIGTDRAVEILHDRGPAMGESRWTSGSGYLIGSRLVLTVAHNVDYRRDLGDDEQLLVRTIEGNVLTARIALACDEQSKVDLALLEITDPQFGEHLLPVTFAQINRDSPAPVTGCWAVGFPQFGEAGPVLPGGSRRETWQVSGQIFPGGLRRAGLLSLQVSSTPRSLPASLAGSEWEGMSGAVVFADAPDGEQAVVGVISAHHPPEGESALTAVPITAVADLPTAAEWSRQFGLTDLGALPLLPRERTKTRAVLVGQALVEVRDPFALEVHRPVQPGSSQAELPELPAYVPREHDTELGLVVQAAVEGGSQIAVLVGGSSTGKTRTCWEALQLLRGQEPEWRLWHPIDPTRPDAALRELPGIGPRTVVWLNEAQFYLDVADGDLGERVAAGLRELLRDAARAPVLVLATLWPQYWDDLTAGPAGGRDSHAQARELLAGHDITVPAAFTAAQLDELSQAGDARLVLASAAAQDGQVIQFLAGAPELLARYRNAPPAAAALIHAAMDARRLGMGVGVPEAFLDAAAPGYMTDTEWDTLSDDWLKEALTYTAKPCMGVRGPLTLIRPRPAASRATGPVSPGSGGQSADSEAAMTAGPLYRLADYLDQYGRQHRKTEIPPADFWAAAAGHAFPSDQTALGEAAHDRGLYRAAAQLYKNAAAHGNRHATGYLAATPPALWAAAHAPVDDLLAVAELVGRLQRAGTQQQVTALADRAAAHVPLDNPYTVADLVDELLYVGAEQQATALADRAAAHVSLDNPGAVAELLGRLQRADGQQQVTLLADRAAAHISLDNPRAVARLLEGLQEAGAHQQVTELLDRDPAAHISLGNPDELADLLATLQKVGAHQQVTVLLHRDPAAHASLGDPYAVLRLLGRLLDVSAQQQFAALADRALACLSLDDLYSVTRLLEGQRVLGAHQQFSALADHAAHVSLDNPYAVAHLLDVLRRLGGQQEVTKLADRAAHVSLDNPYAVADLLRDLQEAGTHHQFTTLADRAAAHVSLNDPQAVARMLGRLRALGAHQQATTLLHRDPAAHVSLDDPQAVADLLDDLQEAGARQQVAELANRAAAHGSLDNPGAVAILLDRLQGMGARQQATTLLHRDPAAHVSLENSDEVARLLDGLRVLGAQQQAIALADRAAAHVSLNDPYAVSRLLDGLWALGAQQQAIALADRAAAHVSLNDPQAVAFLLGRLHALGARQQVTTLLHRDPAAHVSLDKPDKMTRLANLMGGQTDALADLLGSLRALGAPAAQQVTALVDRLPGAGMFELFLEQHGHRDQFQFGREADGTPSAPWSWDDLD